MRRLLSGPARAGLAAVVFLLVLAVTRWGPIHAEPPWDVRALPLAGPTVLLAILAALTGHERRPGPVRPLLAATVLSLLAMAGIVVLRGPSGLPLEVSDPTAHRGPGDPDGALGHLAPAPVDVLGRDLRDYWGTRRWWLRWAGELRVPEAGRYRLWVTGRGRVEVDRRR